MFKQQDEANIVHRRCSILGVCPAGQQHRDHSLCVSHLASIASVLPSGPCLALSKMWQLAQQLAVNTSGSSNLGIMRYTARHSLSRA
jgi:hypothetical protein